MQFKIPNNIDKRKSLVVAVVALVLIAAGASAYFYQKNKNSKIVSKIDPRLTQTEQAPLNKQIEDLKNKLNTKLSDQDRYKTLTDLAANQNAVGDLQDARNNLLEALSLSPDNIYVLQQLAIVSSRMKDYDAVRKYLDRAIKVDPANTKLYQDQISKLTSASA